jgi:hypothetical protein
MADTKHLLQVLQLEMENSSVVCKMEVWITSVQISLFSEYQVSLFSTSLWMKHT